MADGEAGKRLGITWARRHANPQWWHGMIVSGRVIAWHQDYLTTEHIVRHMLKHFPDIITHEQRAIGPLILELKRRGFVVPTKAFRLSNQPSNHRRPQRVWRSLIGPRSRKLVMVSSES